MAYNYGLIILKHIERLLVEKADNKTGMKEQNQVPFNQTKDINFVGIIDT